MRAIKINFGGPNAVGIDWNSEVDGISAVGQRAAVSVMTQLGSDRVLLERGTQVAETLLSYGAFDLLGIQHALNFGALKARADMREYEQAGRDIEDRVAGIRMTLIDVKDNSARVGVTASNQAGEATNEITNLP